jgi:hypothetical protein
MKMRVRGHHGGNVKLRIRASIKRVSGIKLVCTEAGAVQTVTGEARSAEVQVGNVVDVTSENEHVFYGILSIQGSFVTDPGLSGKRGPSTQVGNSIEVAVQKSNVGEDLLPHNFWARFKIEVA